MLWSGSSSICDGSSLREGLFVERRPQAGPLCPDSRLQRRAPESHTVMHMRVPSCLRTCSHEFTPLHLTKQRTQASPCFLAFRSPQTSCVNSRVCENYWVMRAVFFSLPASVTERAPCLSLLAVATRVRGRTAGSLVGERRGRKGNQATWANTWGSAQTPSHTDVLAAEAARKQASTLFLPLFLSLCLFFVCSLSLSLSALPCFLFALWSPPFCAACPVSASHLDDYSKAKGARGRIEETLNTAKRLMSLLD